MKAIIFWSLLLLLGLSCKRPVEPVGPGGTTPPVSTTTPPSATTTSPPSSTTTGSTFVIPVAPVANYDNVPLPPEGCRIVRTVYKTVTLIPPFLDPETITIGSKTATVHTNTITTYSYDAQGRLVKELRRQWRNAPLDSLVYRYLSDRVIVEERTWQYQEKRYFFRADTFMLNSRGLAIRQVSSLKPQTYSTIEYDSDGFRTRYISSTGGVIDNYVINNQNILTYSSYLDGGFGTTTAQYDYYLMRPNFPQTNTFRGRESKNLMSRRVLFSKGSQYYPTGDVYQENFYYEFDARGRVKRRIAYSYPLNPGWPFQTDSDGIGITDYQYECP